jgi:hypothetical protein
MFHKLWWHKATIAFLLSALLALGLMQQTEAQPIHLQSHILQTSPQFDRASQEEMCWLNRWGDQQSQWEISSDKLPTHQTTHCRRYDICWENQWDIKNCHNGRGQGSNRHS